MFRLDDGTTRWARSAAALVAGVGAAWLFACDDEGLIGSDFEGDPIYTVERFTLDVENDFEMGELAHPRRALFWVRGGAEGAACDVVEQAGTSRPAELGQGELNVFEAPPDSVLAKSDGGARYGVARVMLYDDRNDNRRKDDDEPFVGDSHVGFVYAPKDVDEEDGPTGTALPEGFHPVSFPIACNPIPKGSQDCGVELGKACTDDSECGDEANADCLTGRPLPGFEHGSCGVTLNDSCCEPEGARLFARSPGRGAPDKAWVKACRSDADCRRAEDYYCAHAFGICMPRPELAAVFGRLPPRVICSDFTVDGPLGGRIDVECADRSQAQGGDNGQDRDDDDAGMTGGGGGMGPDGPPDDCVPPDPRCDGIPGGGSSDDGSEGNGGDGPGPRPDQPTAQCGA